MDGAIFISGLGVLIAVAALALLLSNPQTCFPIQGIDHNGKNEPFTIWIGKC